MGKMKSTPEFKAAWNKAKEAQNLDNDDRTVEVHGKILVMAFSRDKAYDLVRDLWRKGRGISMNSFLFDGLSEEPNEVQEDGEMDFNFHWEGDYQTMRDFYHDMNLMDGDSFCFCGVTLSRIDVEFEDVADMFEYKKGDKVNN